MLEKCQNHSQNQCGQERIEQKQRIKPSLADPLRYLGHPVCHTADERLLEFPKDLASMFLTIKYQRNFKTLQSVLQSIPELDTVEQETFDTAWNFLDKRMLKFKDKAQKCERRGEYVCCR